MKKLLLTLACLLGFAAAQATEATIDFTAQGYENAQEIVTVAVDNNITLTFDKGTNSNSPKYYNSGTAIRVYGGGTMTVTGASNAIINSVTFTLGSNGIHAESTVSEGTLDAAAGTITGIGANSVVFTQGGTSGHVRIQKLTVDYTIDENAPVLSDAALSFETNEFAVAQGEAFTAPALANPNGLTVAYTSSNEAVATVDAATGSVTVVGLGETTITAASEATDKFYAGSASYTLEVYGKVENIAAFLALANTGVNYELGCATTVAYQNGKNMYITDGTDWLLVYGSLDNEYTNGMTLPAGIRGAYSTYNNLVQFAPVASTFPAGTEGTAVAPTVAEVSAITTAQMNHYIQLDGVSIADGVITQGEATITLYDKFKLGTEVIPATAENATVKGFVGIFKETVQFHPIEVIAEGTDEPEDPSYTLTLLAADDNSWTYENVTLPSALTSVWAWNSYGYLKGSAYSGGGNAAEAWAISPVIDCAKATTISVAFTHAINFLGEAAVADHCSVYVREEGATTWTALTVPTWPAGSNWTFVESGSIDLAAYAGKKVQLGFKYVSTEATTPTWEIKNLIFTSNGELTIVVTEEEPAPTVVASVAEFNALASADAPTVTINAPVTVVYQNGSYLYIKDETAWGLVYGKPATYAKGDVIPAGITGTAALYNTAPQMSAPVAETFLEATAGTPVEPTTIACEEISADLVHQYILIENVTIEGSDRNFTMTDESGVAVTLYNQFNDETRYNEVVTIPTGANYNVYGIVSLYKGAAQVIATNVVEAAGISDVEIENGPAVYYNLQGIEVENPENGIYVRVQGGKASKVVIR